MKQNKNIKIDGNENFSLKVVILKGFSNYIIYSNGKVYNRITEKWLGQSGRDNRYITVALKDDDGVWHYMSLHKLIFEAFNGSVPHGKQINHINENKNENNIENLEAITPKENCLYGTRNKRISNTMTGQKRIKQSFTVTVDNDPQNTYYFNSITAMTNQFPSETRYIWRYRLYKNMKPKRFYLDYTADGKTLLIEPTSEQYKNRLEEYEQNKRMSDISIN